MVLTDKEKIQYLLCALRHSGKTTWSDVGKEFNLKTKSAYKRFNSIVKAAEKGSAADAGSVEVATPKRKGTTTPRTEGTPAKKLKKENKLSGDVSEGHDEELEDTPVKGGQKGDRAALMIEYQEESDASDIRGMVGREETLDDEKYGFDAVNVKAEIET